MRRNHVIDPQYFWDSIEEFSFEFDIYVLNSKEIDDYGMQTYKYTKQTIRGSLQPKRNKIIEKTTGNTIECTYAFYCKSLYRIDIGDIIEYNGMALRCEEIKPIDEFGVRSAKLRMIDINKYRDLNAYIKYLNGEEFI